MLATFNEHQKCPFALLITLSIIFNEIAEKKRPSNALLILSVNEAKQ